MIKPIGIAQIQRKTQQRLKDKSLKQHLLYNFLNRYGYDKGEVTASAIIDDILNLIDDYFLISRIDDDLHYLHYGQLVWMAVPVDEYPQRAKSIAQTRMQPVILTFWCDEDIDHITSGFDSASLRKKRIVRWTDEAFNQGALLTQLDLSSLLGVSHATVCSDVKEIQSSGKILPTRGNIHDMSGAITHKREIITLYLENYLTPEIAKITNHSKEAVDRYIKDFNRVLILWNHGITDLDQICHLSRLAKPVAQQYIDLLPEEIFKKHNPKLVDNETTIYKVGTSGETEAGSAGEQPARDNR